MNSRGLSKMTLGLLLSLITFLACERQPVPQVDPDRPSEDLQKQERPSKN